MRVVHLSTDDLAGGAARATYRLHKGVRSIGVDSLMVVQHKSSNDASVYPLSAGSGNQTLTMRDLLSQMWLVLLPHLDRVGRRFYPRRELFAWSVGWVPTSLNKQVAELDPDLVHLHWLGGGFVSIRAISKLRWPLVWTLHDMWAFTGGCHYALGCLQYQHSCGKCPQLGSHANQDLSRWTWKHKKNQWQQINPVIVAPSRWLARCASQSSLLRNLRIEVIPNGIDTTQFRPIDKNTARTLMGLPINKKLVLFGAIDSINNRFKGFEYLVQAMENLAATCWKDVLELVILGAPAPRNPLDLGFKTHYLGHLHDELTLAAVYSAADVFVAPSIQDNLPNTVMEALACGTPCVAFDIGGMGDMITHKENGFLAHPYDANELAEGITWTLVDKHRCHTLSFSARQKVEQYFDVKHVAQRYIELYSDLLKITDS